MNSETTAAAESATYELFHFFVLLLLLLCVCVCVCLCLCAHIQFCCSGLLRPDPFAMKPFCGYNIGDYFAHWLSMEQRAPDPKLLPKIFHVNWFRKSDKGACVFEL